jgi:hypothetical protein
MDRGDSVLTGIQQASIGACPHLGGWDATTAASGQSVLSGVLAGFVFGGIVVVLSTREGRRGRETARALKLLFSAFFGLVVTAYLFADQAADTNCVRAFAEENLAGALLGTFALVLIVSLTWLVVAYRLHAEGTLGFFRSLIYFASAFVVLLLCTSSYSAAPRAAPLYLSCDVRHWCPWLRDRDPTWFMGGSCTPAPQPGCAAGKTDER